MKKYIKILFLSFLISCFYEVKADFGDADFPIGTFQNSPKSYHDGWCRSMKNKCRIRFQGPAMWVEGQGGIDSSQYIRYRYDNDGDPFKFLNRTVDHYSYLTYKSKTGEEREALFIFNNDKAHRDFAKALIRWKKQIALPVPNYRYPNSQGPQDTQGRDKGLNPYDNPPIKDWSIKTNEKGMKGNINCDSPVWENKPRCN